MMLVVHVVDDAHTAAFPMPRSLPTDFPYASSTGNDITSFRIQAYEVFKFHLCRTVPDTLYSTLIWLCLDNDLWY